MASAAGFSPPMTAVNVIVTRGAAHLYTDAATYGWDGKVLFFGPKIFVEPHLPLALAVRGIGGAAFDLGAALAARWATFDDLADDIDDELPDIFAAYLRQFAGRSDVERAAAAVADIVITGWSETSDAPAAYFIRTHESKPPAGYDAVTLTPPAFRLIDLDGVVPCPFPDPALWAQRPIAFDLDGSEAELDADAIKLMEMQRATVYSPCWPGQDGGHVVGGYVQAVTITRTGATRRVIHRWPEDRIGRKISPTQEVTTMNGQVAFATAFGAMKRFTDPTTREVNGMFDALMARITGLSDKLPPARDLWGEERKPAEIYGRVYDALSPVAVSADKDSPIDAEIERLDIGPKRIQKKGTFQDAEINFREFPAVYDEYVRLAGNELKHPVWGLGAKDLLNAVVSGRHSLSSQYFEVLIGAASKAAFIQNTISEYRKLAQERIMAQRDRFPEFVDYVTARAAQRREEKNPFVYPSAQRERLPHPRRIVPPSVR